MLIWLSTLSTTAYTAETLDLAKYRGSVVVLDFWASWCVPCKRSFPWLNEMHTRYADEGLVIIGVNVDKDADEAQAFLEKYPAPVSYTHLRAHETKTRISFCGLWV